MYKGRKSPPATVEVYPGKLNNNFEAGYDERFLHTLIYPLKKMKQRFSNDINIRNRQAGFQYELLDKYIAGIVLTGTEIKSIREGKVNLQDGYCYLNNGEVFVKGINITPYAQGTHYNHDATRERKLLMKRAEIRKLEGKVEEKGLTLVPIRLFINDRGLAKLEIALGKGKKLYDKRETIKDRDAKRELNRIRI